MSPEKSCGNGSVNYTLTLSSDSALEEHVFTTVEAAINFYEEVLNSSLGWGGAAKLANNAVAKCTWIFLCSGMCAIEIKEDLETVFHWSDDDRLKVRPYLKERYLKT